jgi:signal transduction histidine kinase
MKILIITGGAVPETVLHSLATEHSVTVLSPSDILQPAHQNPHDVAILDCRVPDPDFATTRHILQRFSLSLICWTTTEHATTALATGFDEILLDGSPPALWEHRITQADRPAQHRRSEAARRESEELLEEITDQIPGVVYRFILTPDGDRSMPFVSRPVRDIFGVDPAIVSRDVESLFVLVLDEDLPALNASIATSATTMTPWECEFRILLDGQLRWIHGHSLPRPGEDGSIIWHGMLRDNTHRKHLEERLRIADRLASVGTLSAGIAHEINNPLAFVVSNLTSALEDLDHLDQQDLEDALGAALRGAERIAEIVSGLRTFAYVKSTALEPVDLHQVLEDALQMTGAELRHHAALVIDIQNTPTVIGRRNDLVQVLVNLLINARHALPLDTPANNRIDVILRTDDSTDELAIVEIHDNGHGIPHEQLSTIFDPFYTTKEIGEGTGLGLYICHNLVAGMNGRIEVESAPDEGSTFRVFLPTLRDKDFTLSRP